MDTAIVVFTRDLRLHDNPALHQACARARQVVPLFVADPAIAAPPNRARFLAESLADLRASLRERGADLVLRRGDPAAEVIRLAREVHATAVYIADDVSHYATARRLKLERECARHRIELILTPGLTVVPPAELKPAGGDHYRVFTPYWRAWRGPPGGALPGPAAHQLPPIEKIGRLPAKAAASPVSPGWPRGETAGRQRFASWRQRLLAGYGENHDDLAGDATSRLSAYLRFGCVSPLEVAIGALDRPAGDEQGEEFCRQLAWRDFFYQVTAAFPDIARKNYRPGAAWHEDRRALDAWREGQTGIPIVDAGHAPAGRRGLHAQPGPDDHRVVPHPQPRHRLAARPGALRLPAPDGDVANNAGNWQWVAGTGNNTRPNRVMNPLRQAQRFDRSGEYVRRYVPELAGLDPAWIQTPWQLPPAQRVRLGYPGPLVELA